MQAVSTAVMASMLDTSPEKVREMANSGEIPYMPVGRIFKFYPPSVFEALERRREIARSTGRSLRSQRSRRKVF